MSVNKNSKSKTNNNSKSKKKATRPTLTAKQNKFIIEFIKSGNATEAAIKAGYSKKTANVIGSENLTKPYIIAEIEKRTFKREQSKIASADEVLEFFTAVLRGEVEDENIGPYGKKINTRANVRDRSRAAENLARRYALFTDRVEISDKRENSILEDLSERVGNKKDLEQVDFESEDDE